VIFHEEFEFRFGFARFTSVFVLFHKFGGVRLHRSVKKPNTVNYAKSEV